MSRIELEKSPSGATSSKLDVRFDLIPPTFIRRLARRYALGIEKGHVQYNWRLGMEDPDFIQARINHFENHWNKWKSGDYTDDNLGAMAWGLAFFAELENSPCSMNALRKVFARITAEEKREEREEIPDVSYRAAKS